VGVKRGERFLGEYRLVVAVALDLDDERRGHVLALVGLEHGEDLVKRRDPLVGTGETQPAHLVERHLLHDAGNAAHATHVGVVDHDDLVVRREMHVELCAKAVLAGATEGRHRVLGYATREVMQAAMGVAMTTHDTPAHVDGSVPPTRRTTEQVAPTARAVAPATIPAPCRSLDSTMSPLMPSRRQEDSSRASRCSWCHHDAQTAW